MPPKNTTSRSPSPLLRPVDASNEMMEEGLVGSSVCRLRSGNGYHYQRLPRAPPTTPPGRGTRLGRRPVLGSAAWSRLRRRCRASARRWCSPLQLLNRILDAYIASMLSQPLDILKTGVSSAAAAAAAAAPSSPPPKLRRDASTGSSSSRRRDAAGGRGVMLNICVAEVLLRRTTSEVRRSPLQQQQQPATKDARRSRVRRA